MAVPKISKTPVRRSILSTPSVMQAQDMGTIGLEHLLIEDYNTRISTLAEIRDQVVSAGYNWDMYGIVDAHTNHVITDHDVCVAYVNIGEDIKYL